MGMTRSIPTIAPFDDAPPPQFCGNTLPIPGGGTRSVELGMDCVGGGLGGRDADVRVVGVRVHAPLSAPFQSADWGSLRRILNPPPRFFKKKIQHLLI